MPVSTKRLLDFLAALAGLVLLSPLLLVASLVVWLQDFVSPFYVAPRMARGGGTFRMVKLRSMVVDAHKTGVNSTSGNDRRITLVGRFIRRYKLDEIMQLWNVLKGDMSLVGPRPQVLTDAALYTEEEKRMLTVRPGVTDLASIVFSDEGDILEGSANPDLRYNQIIRPWKSRLALLYIEKRTLWLDLRIILFTAIAIVSRPAALKGVQSILESWAVDPLLRRMAAREESLLPYPPPGATEVVASYP
jgi:lipopolysaccharide/colanic/teichoic acid biosynthesis glycosyltransferase